MAKVCRLWGIPHKRHYADGISPKVISERIGHANVGFLLETYAHVLGNDDREAAEQAAEFLLGDAWQNGEGSG